MVFVFYLFFHMSDVCCFTFGIHVHIVNGFLCLIKALNKLVLDFSTINCFIKVNPLRSGIFHWIFPQFVLSVSSDICHRLLYSWKKRERGCVLHQKWPELYWKKTNALRSYWQKTKRITVRETEKAPNPFFRNCQWQFSQTWYSQKIKL